MTIEVKLGDGHTAQLHDPTQLTNGQRRPIVAASDRMIRANVDPAIARELQRAVARGDEQRQADLLAAMELSVDQTAPLKVGEVAITVLVASWTLDMPIPSERPLLDEDGELVGSEVLDDISAYDYDRLQRGAGALIPQTRWSGDPPAGKAKRSPASKRR